MFVPRAHIQAILPVWQGIRGEAPANAARDQATPRPWSSGALFSGCPDLPDCLAQLFAKQLGVGSQRLALPAKPG